MLHRNIIPLLATIALLTGSLQAQARLETDTIALGDQTVLTLDKAEQYPGVEALSQGGIVALSQLFDTATGEQHTLLTSFEPGDHWLHLPSGDSLKLVVTDVEVDTTTTDIRDIATIERVPYTFWEIFRWILLGLLIAGAGVGVWWYVKHRPQVQQALGLSEKPDTRSPYERASDNLSSLRERHLWQSGKVKEYYTELTDVVRRFIEESTEIRATEMTSNETIEAVRTLADPAPLHRLFTLADLVKFAKDEPHEHEHEEAYRTAQEYIGQLWERVRPITPEATAKEADEKHE